MFLQGDDVVIILYRSRGQTARAVLGVVEDAGRAERRSGYVRRQRSDAGRTRVRSVEASTAGQSSSAPAEHRHRAVRRRLRLLPQRTVQLRRRRKNALQTHPRKQLQRRITHSLTSILKSCLVMAALCNRGHYIFAL